MEINNSIMDIYKWLLGLHELIVVQHINAAEFSFSGRLHCSPVIKQYIFSKYRKTSNISRT